MSVGVCLKHGVGNIGLWRMILALQINGIFLRFNFLKEGKNFHDCDCLYPHLSYK